MSLNSIPSGERVHLAFFGRRNVGKSSLVNAITGQQLAIVSDTLGTTTDPVFKAMELLPLGPVIIIDTPGIDDEGELGKLRVQKSYQVLNKTDVAVVVIDSTIGLAEQDKKLIERIEQKQIPYLIVYNKCDLTIPKLESELSDNEICVSSTDGKNITELKDKLANLLKEKSISEHIIADRLNENDVVVLVTPIDESAPKGRLILPQQQTIRDILDSHAVAVVTQDTQLKATLSSLKTKPKLVITDSQAFGRVSKDIPKDILLTSFSILFANYKGNLKLVVEGVKALDSIQDSDPILISEGCTHHRQCGDIGTVKLPKLIQKYTGVIPKFSWTSGTEFPEDLTPYKLIIHCGGCMLNEREMKYRLQCANDQGISITNYGIAIAYMNGILKHSVEIFPEIYKIL